MAAAVPGQVNDFGHSDAARAPRAVARVRALFALPGFHRVQRGAEVALESIAAALAKRPDWDVTVVGSGRPGPDRGYRYVRAGCIPRERFTRWPKIPALRDHYAYEELTFLPGVFRRCRSRDYDVTITCGYPWLNWALRANRRAGRPAHVFVTQNGDWPVHAGNREYRWFGCDGLVCTNPEFFERNRSRWPSVLIPNGVDTTVFFPGKGDRTLLGVPEGVPLILMVSALIPSKRVVEGIRAAAGVPEAHLVVLGEGETAAEVDRVATACLGQRFRRMTLQRGQMPAAYRCADAVLHMSKDEPFGNVYIEALATGLPVVAHDCDVTRWILGGTSVLVDTDDAESVRAGIVGALQSRAPELVASRREHAKQRFGWPAIGQQYAQFIRGVVERVS